MRQSADDIAHIWTPVELAPSGVDLELAVIDGEGTHTLVFPCRRIATGWIDAATGKTLPIGPTHWRIWGEGTGDEDGAAPLRPAD